MSTASTSSSTSSSAPAIPTLPGIAPSRGARMVARHRVSAVRFGGGHALYIADGNPDADHEWNVVWQALGNSDAGRITEFLEARGGVDAFLWQPPGAASAQRFICPEWHITPEPGEVQQITARFIRLYP